LEKEYWKNSKFIIFTYDKKNPFFEAKNIVYKEYFPIWIRKKGNIFKNIKNFFSFLNTIIKSDLIVLWGGGIIYDEENQSNKSPLDLWLMRVRFFNFFRKHYVFFRWWIDIKNEENLAKVKKIFKKAYKIEVRDQNSFDLLKKLWIVSVLKKDPVFNENWEIGKENVLLGVLKSLDFNKETIKDFDVKGKTIWLALRSGYFVKKSKISDRMEEWIINEIINYLLEQNAKIILLPHSFHETDDLANDFLFLTKFIWNPWIEIKENIKEVYNVYKNKEIDFCFAQRLHSIILCQVYEIPFVGVSYSRKTDEVLKEMM
jgi:polysaccharide pyruvyl transferase WcaK-like protein